MRRISIFTLTIFLLTNSFFPKTFAQELNSFTPDGIQDFLDANPEVNSAAKFLERLPREYKQHWIMMTHSESAQTGTATSPRFLLPSADASKVFAFELETMPQQGSELIEYLHFDETLKKFRFHLIDMATRSVTKEAPSCPACHFGRPNWDAYDSWGGMLPFNRDRIYEGSEEAKAIERLFKNLKDDPIGRIGAPMRLAFPRGIDANGITMFDGGPDLGPGTVTCDNEPNTVEALVEEGPPISYPGGMPFCVKQGGRYLLLHHSKNDPDEGRGVELFDNFTQYNTRRVAQELIDHPKKPVDIRPIALAIAKECVSADNLTDFAPLAVLGGFREYHNESLKYNTGQKLCAVAEPRGCVNDLVDDTHKRRENLPKLKADLQGQNLDGLIKANGGTPSPETITQQVFRRSTQNFEPDMVTECRIGGDMDGCMIDREIYQDQDETIALFRFFLEPPKVDPTTGMEVDESRVRVDKWSMSNGRPGIDRAKTYTFGDLFGNYVIEITSALTEALMSEGQSVTCRDLAVASRMAFGGIMGDIDSDGDVDRDDLGILLQEQGKSVSQSAARGARCDLNGDGQINFLDAHELIQLCSRPQCATQ